MAEKGIHFERPNGELVDGGHIRMFTFIIPEFSMEGVQIASALENRILYPGAYPGSKITLHDGQEEFDTQVPEKHRQILVELRMGETMEELRSFINASIQAVESRRSMIG